jgi:hypothetical protein
MLSVLNMDTQDNAKLNVNDATNDSNEKSLEVTRKKELHQKEKSIRKIICIDRHVRNPKALILESTLRLLA